MSDALTIALGDRDRLARLFSYPNIHGSTETLADTILHWFRQTLTNDGTAKGGTTNEELVASVAISGDTDYALVIDGADPTMPARTMYAERLPRFLRNGDTALAIVAQIKADGRWDPSPDGPPPAYRPWQFFLPLGLPMVNQRSLQFFHYPPIRLLEQTRDYLNDPVPARCFELLEANGVAPSEVALYNAVIDATPIAAADTQGSKKGGDGKPAVDNKWGPMPIQYFGAYQKAQVELLLNPAAAHSGFTIPIVVYGNHPRQIFEKLYNVALGTSVNGKFVPAAAVADIIPGRRTPVVGANHPYNFYATAQQPVGSGTWLSAESCRDAVDILRGDLAIARWQKRMADDPSQPPGAVLAECMQYWNDAAQAAGVCALASHQASLLYPDQGSLAFSFERSLAEAADTCSRNANQPCKGATR